jgi:predicted nicotinamide N-methyase
MQIEIFFHQIYNNDILAFNFISRKNLRFLIDFRVFHNGVQILHDIMIKNSIENINLVNNGNNNDSNNYDTSFQYILAILETIFLIDYDFIQDFVNIGGYLNLKKIMKSNTSNDTINDIESLISTIISSNCNYSNNIFSIEENNQNKIVNIKEFKFQTKNNSISIWIRNVPNKKMYGEGQKGVGYVLWSSSIILSKFLLRNCELTNNKNILEIGAGLALSGLVSSYNAKSVLLTDYNENVVNNIQFNIDINSGKYSINNTNSLIGSNIYDCNVKSAILDWDYIDIPKPFSFSYIKSKQFGCISIGNNKNDINNNDNMCNNNNNNNNNNKDDDDDIISINVCSTYSDNKLDKIKNNEKYDLIIGSDMVCLESEAIGVCKVILTKLAANMNSKCIFVIPQPQHRYGVEAFMPALESIGMDVICIPIFHSNCTTKYKTNESYLSKSFTQTIFNNLDEESIINNINDIIKEASTVENMDKFTDNLVENEYFMW